MRPLRVAVAVSGGVDSAVAALLLRKTGFDIQGVFMKNWDAIDETGTCSAEKDFKDAQIVCDKLNIPLTRVDFVRRYWNEVFSDLIEDYKSGFTPNPDILCNKNIKFGSFYDHCRKNLNVDAIATGHYADTSFGPFLENYVEGKGVKLLQPFDKFKDQTFFLSQIGQESLRRTMFPLARLKKTKVRSIAKENCLENVSNKRDSVGICFVGKRNFQSFISEYIPSNPGNFIDIDTGMNVGTHDGIHNWTVGQRCRLGGRLKPYFVIKKNIKDNSVYIGAGTDHLSLKTDIFITGEPHWIDEEPSQLKNNNLLKCQFRFQHTKPLTECSVFKSNNSLLVKLSKPLRAITPGQYAVFYHENECFGSARIINLGPSSYFVNKS